jgi:UDP-3-O-[3-hydroxymyristoyl] glucosamine N-acyltransferase
VDSLTLGHLIHELGGVLRGDANTQITRLAPLASASKGHLSFLSHPQYASQLKNTNASCVIVSPEQADLAAHLTACIVTPNPYAYWAKTTQLWRRLSQNELKATIHPSAVIHSSAIVHPSAEIGPLCVVEADVQIGARSRLASRVTISEGCQIGEDCLLHSGVVIGADGFGFAKENSHWVKIEQLGAVRIGNQVEIGANSCVDRGALEDTVIEDGVKIDNLVQIGHNVHIGAHTAMAGCVGIAGSARIGAYCTIGGGAVVLGHLELADHVHVSAASVVTHSLMKAGQYSGVFPIDDNRSWHKNAASLKQLNTLRERIKQLEKSLAYDQRS